MVKKLALFIRLKTYNSAVDLESRQRKKFKCSEIQFFVQKDAITFAGLTTTYKGHRRDIEGKEVKGAHENTALVSRTLSYVWGRYIYIWNFPMLCLYHSNQKTSENSAEIFLNGNKIYP